MRNENNVSFGYRAKAARAQDEGELGQGRADGMCEARDQKAGGSQAQTWPRLCSGLAWEEAGPNGRELGSDSLAGDRQGHGELGGPALHMIRRKAMGDAVRCRHATFSLLEVSLSPCLLTSAACTFSPLLPNVTVTVLRPLLATRLDNRGGFYTLPCHQPTPLLIPNPSSPRRPPGRMLARLALPRR